MFERAPAATTHMYSSAMGWGLEQISSGHVELEHLADLILLDGGVQAVARVFAKSRGIRGRITTITNSEYAIAASKLPRAGMLVGDAKIDLQEALALVRKDTKGRRVVHLIEADPHRVRAAVMRYSRREEPAADRQKSRFPSR